MKKISFEEVAEQLTAAGKKAYHAKDALTCRTCQDTYGPVVDALTHGYCADCFQELSCGVISSPKSKLVADTSVLRHYES